MKCSSCGLVIILEFDEHEQEFNKPWTDLEGRYYCDQCFYELYTVPFEKSIDNYNHDNKKSEKKQGGFHLNRKLYMFIRHI